MEAREVARFEHAGDVRVMLLSTENGQTEVREDLSGPSAQFAYGEDERSLRVGLSDDSTQRLVAVIAAAGAGASLADYLANEAHDIMDLMDLCDRSAISYSFASLGSSGDVAFRAS